MKKATATKTTPKKLMEPAEVKKLFAKLTKGNKSMNEDQFYQFLGNDLGLDGEDPLFGHIATNIMGIKKIEEVTQQNFENLFRYTKVQSLQDLKDKVKSKQLHTQMKNTQTFNSMYKKLFDLYTGKYTTLDLSVAQQLWTIYLKDKMTLYKQLIEYVANLQQKSKVHKDLWNMMLEFANQVKDVEKDYKQQDGWPVFIDKFVDHVKTSKN